MTLVPGRECGGCTVCCTELHINAPSLKKLAGVRCPNLREDCLCAIYETRPKTCSDFECGWRVMAALGDHWRPDRAGIVLIPKTKDNPPGYRANAGVQIMLLRPDALRNAELPGLVAQWVEALVPLFLTVAAPVGFIAPSAFLNEIVADAVRGKDRAAVTAALDATVKALSARRLERAPFAST
jgi:hypothetical protein